MTHPTFIQEIIPNCCRTEIPNRSNFIEGFWHALNEVCAKVAEFKSLTLLAPDHTLQRYLQLNEARIL